jgi:hypothetical protein
MKRGLTLAALIILMFNFGYSQKASKEKPSKESKEEAKKNKEEIKKVKDELKNYLKHPEQYKAKMDEMQAAKDTGDAQVSRLTAALQSAQNDLDDAQKKAAASDDQVKQLQTENDTLKASVSTAKENDMKGTPPSGTVYKVQLGVYKGLNINKSFDQPRYIGYEDVGGMNRYVISYFPDSLTAAKLVTDIRKLGVRDAFVAKYIDGTRVYEWNLNPKYRGKKVPETLDEALDNGKPAKKGKKSKPADQ